MGRAHFILWLWSSLLVKAVSSSSANFTKCYGEAFREYMTMNKTDPMWHTWFWQDDLYGLKNKSAKPQIVLTRAGCEEFCGPDPQYNTVIDAFQIMTTWVLPAIALMSQLPYESLSIRWRKNLAAFGNWVGAPAAAMTTTFWNIVLIHKCAVKPGLFKLPGRRDEIREALYILSCINQYEYPRHKHPRPEQADSDLRRDSALLKGILYPYFRPGLISEKQRSTLANLNQHLAFQLRLQRRKGVYPIFISIGWFGMAFAFSIVISFADIGDNTTAHSLALGLLLSWVPVMLFATVIDRNPTSATRCSELIQRWLFNIDRLLPTTVLPSLPLALWRAQRGDQEAADETGDFDIGEYMGQGRTLRYCGIADTVLDMIVNPKDATLDVPDLSVDEGHEKFRARLTERPWGWVAVWLVSQAIVSTSFSMAFMVSFNTPTQGLGCRSLLYLSWWLLVLPSWLILGVFQEPNPTVRNLMIVPNLLAAAILFAIMLVQSFGGLNSCVCKTSVFGRKPFGGYMDFMKADFYKEHYDVEAFWGSATGIGGAAMVISISWLAWKWHKSSALWRVTEDTTVRVEDDVSLEWLT